MTPPPTSNGAATPAASNGAPATTTHVTIASILSHSILGNNKADAATTRTSPHERGWGDIPPRALSSSSEEEEGAEAMAAAVETKSTTATDGVGVDAAAFMEDDKANQSHLLQVLWSDGSTSWVPLSRLLAERKQDANTLLQVVRYLHTHDLLICTPSEGGGEEATTTTTTTSWSRRLPDHVQKQLPIVLVPDKKHQMYLNDLQHLHVIDKAFQRGFNQMVARKRPANDNSYRALREGVYEIFVEGATTRKPAGSAGGEEAYVLDGPGSNGNGAGSGPNTLVVVQKGSKMYTSMVLRLKKQLEACLPHGDGKIEERSIRALTSFAQRTASRDPSLSELRKLAKAESAHDQDQPSDADAPPAEASAPPDTITPSTSFEDGTNAVTGTPVADTATEAVKASANDMVFGSYSCLVSAKGKDAQFRHVDAHSYERQYCMAITGGTSLPTVTHIVVDQLDTPAQVVNLWNDLVRDYAKVHPSFDHESEVLADDATLQSVADSIQTVMEATPWMMEWIAEYGKVLSRPGRTVEVCGKWSPGTVLSVPGGNVHHAPPNEEFRSILFFTSSPAGMKAYDVDMQYSGPTLTASLLIGLREAADDDQGTTTTTTPTLTSDLHHEYMHRVQYMSVREDPSVVDFTSYLHDAIPMDHPIRAAMLESHQHKLSQLERDAAKAKEEAMAAMLVEGGRRLRLNPKKKKPRRS